MVKVSDLNDTAANTVTSSTSQPDYGFDWNRLDFDFPTEFIQGEAVEPIILTPHSHLPGGLYDPLPNYLDSAISAFTAWQGSVGAGPITSRPPQSSAGGVNRPARTALLEPPRTVTTAPREQIQAQVSTNNYSRGGAAASNWRGGGGGNGRGGNGHGNRGGQAAHGRSNFYRGNNRGYRGGGGSGNTRGHFNYNFY
ncbi:hypothetical protein TYRP_003273 [Tyrophagus putrescentiae]|nr:hypothetical protein TYRP_003273 [Tyrophagus putrescentiae]